MEIAYRMASASIAKILRKQQSGRVSFEVFTAVTMKNGVFWGVTPCGSCKNRRFLGTQRLLHQDDKNSVN
jgi:uncharacterized protein YbcV (DUF1398 family)